MLIGLTGMYCAGKNVIASLLEERGLSVLDVDKLGHEAIENLKETLFERFGDDIKNSDGSVNRRLLGEKVFGKKSELSALEAIVHPEANRLTEAWVAARKGNGVINAALLHKSSVFERLDGIILVSAPCLTRLIRAKRRDKLPLGVLVKRLASQKQFISQYLAGNADTYKVENPGIGGYRLSAASVKNRARLKRRIDAILSAIGEAIPQGRP